MVMAKKYVFVRMPSEIYEKYGRVQLKMNQDLQRLTGRKDIKLTMPKVFNAVISPSLNDNRIEIDYTKLLKLARQRKGKYEL